MVDIFWICVRVIKLVWKLVRGDPLCTCNRWPGPHTRPRSDRDLTCIHWCRSHTDFLQSLKDRCERLSPEWMVTKALVNATWIVAPVASPFLSLCLQVPLWEHVSLIILQCHRQIGLRVSGLGFGRCVCVCFPALPCVGIGVCETARVCRGRGTSCYIRVGDRG